jgi:hypothetical protein
MNVTASTSERAFLFVLTRRGGFSPLARLVDLLLAKIKNSHAPRSSDEEY